MNKNEGFSTVELLVALLISSIIVTAIGSMLSFNIKSFKHSRETIDVQYESQIAMNQLTSLLSEATYIESVVVFDGAFETTYDLSNLDTLLDKNEIISLSFHSDFLEGTSYVDKLYTLNFDKANNIISNTIESESYELARNVTGFWIAPINGSMKSANLFEITLEFDNNGKTLSLVQQVKMRNKER